MKPAAWVAHGSDHPPDCILVEKSDYDGGDPDLTLVQRTDGLYDLVLYKGANDLAVHALTGSEVREAANRILSLVPPAISGHG